MPDCEHGTIKDKSRWVAAVWAPLQNACTNIIGYKRYTLSRGIHAHCHCKSLLGGLCGDTNLLTTHLKLSLEWVHGIRYLAVLGICARDENVSALFPNRTSPALKNPNHGPLLLHDFIVVCVVVAGGVLFVAC